MARLTKRKKFDIEHFMFHVMEQRYLKHVIYVNLKQLNTTSTKYGYYNNDSQLSQIPLIVVYTVHVFCLG